MSNLASGGWVIDVEEANFQAEVVDRSKDALVLVDFWAPWCQPCRQLSPILEKIAGERGGSVVVAKVNTDENPELANYFQIESIPAVFALKNAQVVDQFTGLLPEAAINELVDALAGPRRDDPFKRAEEFEQSDPAEAEILYRELLNHETGGEKARLALGRLLVARKAYPEALEVLSPLGDAGEFGTEAERLRKQIAMLSAAPAKGEVAALEKKVKAEPENAKLRYQFGSLLAKQASYPEALDQLLLAAELDRELGRNEVKALMVEIFHIIGIRSDLADEFRAKLQSLLY